MDEPYVMSPEDRKASMERLRRARYIKRVKGFEPETPLFVCNTLLFPKTKSVPEYNNEYLIRAHEHEKIGYGMRVMSYEDFHDPVKRRKEWAALFRQIRRRKYFKLWCRSYAPSKR